MLKRLFIVLQVAQIALLSSCFAGADASDSAKVIKVEDKAKNDNAKVIDGLRLGLGFGGSASLLYGKNYSTMNLHKFGDYCNAHGSYLPEARISAVNASHTINSVTNEFRPNFNGKISLYLDFLRVYRVVFGTELDLLFICSMISSSRGVCANKAYYTQSHQRENSDAFYTRYGAAYVQLDWLFKMKVDLTRKVAIGALAGMNFSLMQHRFILTKKYWDTYKAEHDKTNADIKRQINSKIKFAVRPVVGMFLEFQVKKKFSIVTGATWKPALKQTVKYNLNSKSKINTHEKDEFCLGEVQGYISFVFIPLNNLG